MSLTEGKPPVAAVDPPGDRGGAMPTLPGGLFARKSTGLVREVSGKQQIFWNFLSGFPPYGLALGVFFALSGFPGGNLVVAALLAIPLALVIAYTYGLLTAAMPRTGGDYVYVSRILHPFGGLLSSCAFGLAGFTTIAYVCAAFSSLALAPALSTIGLISGSSTLVNWGSTLATSKDWQFGIGCVVIVVGCGMCLGGWRTVRRIVFGIMWLALAGLGVTVLIAIFTSRSTFAAHFNAFGASHGVHNAYQATLAAARKNGVQLGAGFSWAKTIPMVGVLATFGLYSWFSSFIGGEIRQGSSTKVANRNGIGALLVMGSIVLCVVLFFKTFGQDFLTAVNAGGLSPKLGTTPAYFYLTSVQLNNTIVAIALSVAFIGVFPIIVPYQTLFITRYLFAWGFDGLLPKQWTRLNRLGAPDLAIAFTVVFALAVYAWSIYLAKNFVQVLVYNTLFTFLSMGLVAIAAIVFPYRLPALYKASSSRMRVLGVPLLVWTGILSLLSLGFVTYLYFHFAFFGLSNKAGIIPWFAGITIVAAVLYLVPRAVRRREGIDLSLVFKEIPPE